ncbi:MAG: hypothetical protein ACKVII_07900 [Planctomycetales bacterium]
MFSQLAQPVHRVDGMSTDEVAESEATQVTMPTLDESAKPF